MESPLAAPPGKPRPAGTRPSARIAQPIVVATALALIGCGTATTAGPPAPSAPPAPGPAAAPWSAAPLEPATVPAVYLEQWRTAENRDRCAPLAPVDGRDGEPRAATFAGGWAVAYDRPGLRSAFGIAGTGAAADGDLYDDWPHTMRWSDGSYAGYGPEGGTGPNQLAYLVIPGQSCLYNVWSRVGIEHLEALLRDLRFVDAGRTTP